MNILINLAVFAITAIAMEGVAWALHKYVMHGWGWAWHADHHRPAHRGLQKNDLYAVCMALISFLLILNGLMFHIGPLAAVGFGMALYGLGYLLFHDIMFHRRIPGLRIKPRGAYLQRIVRAHRLHHQNSNQKEGGTSFGFLYAPKRFESEP